MIGLGGGGRRKRAEKDMQSIGGIWQAVFYLYSYHSKLISYKL